MSSMKRKWDVSNQELRKQCAEEIIAYIDERGDDQFGIIAADEIIDTVLQRLAPHIYNLALDDARKLIRQATEDLDVRVDMYKTETE